MLEPPGNTQPDAQMALVVGGRLDELDQYPTGVLGVDEVDPGVPASNPI